MEIREAAAMLNNAHWDTSKKTVWSDLGCGTGTFTLALATLLLPGSLMYAIDSNAASLQQVPDCYREVDIKKYKADFINNALPCNAMVSFAALQDLFRNASFSTVQRLGERPSVYRHAPMYAAVIKK